MPLPHRPPPLLPPPSNNSDAFDASCTELTVTANIDSGGRGRPRVTFDVTQGLSAAGVGVFMADGAREWGGEAWRGACQTSHCPCLAHVSTLTLRPALSLLLLLPPTVYIEKPELDAYGTPLPGGPQAQEMHRFLIHQGSESALLLRGAVQSCRASPRAPCSCVC